MLEPKVPIIGAATGFALSFLVGLLSGAAFSIILVRALLFAVIFGGLALAGKFVVDRFLPEIASGAVEPPSSDDLGGANVNITIEDGPSQAAPFSAVPPDSLDGLLPDFLESPGDQSGIPTQPQSLGSQSTGAPSRPVPSISAAPRETLGQTGYNPGKADSAGASAATGTMATSGHSSAGGLDVLPDLQDFIPPVTRSEGDDEEESAPSGAIGSRDTMFVAPDTRGTNAETETMAKAIRTILSRDS